MVEVIETDKVSVDAEKRQEFKYFQHVKVGIKSLLNITCPVCAGADQNFGGLDSLSKNNRNAYLPVECENCGENWKIVLTPVAVMWDWRKKRKRQ